MKSKTHLKPIPKPSLKPVDDHSEGHTEGHKTEATAATGLTKTAMVLEAIKAGKETASVAIPWIQQTYGVAIRVEHFNSTKGSLRSRGLIGGGNRRPSVNVAKPTAPANGDAIGLVRGVKNLLSQYGPDQVRAMVDELAD